VVEAVREVRLHRVDEVARLTGTHLIGLAGGDEPAAGLALTAGLYQALLLLAGTFEVVRDRPVSRLF